MQGADNDQVEMKNKIEFLLHIFINKTLSNEFQ